MWQLIELILFAWIAFIVISKLLSVLGIVNDEDKAMPKKIIDAIVETTIIKKSSKDFAQLTNNSDLHQEITQIEYEIPSFTFEAFLDKVKIVFEGITQLHTRKINTQELEEIIDKTRIEAILKHSAEYANQSIELRSAKIYRIDRLGNEILITVQFQTNNQTELWTFKKNKLSPEQAWYLTEING